MATTDDSPAGVTALGYLKALLQIGRVRLVSFSGGVHGKWEPYAPLLMTPMQGAFVNIVCCVPELWTRKHAIRLHTRNTDGSRATENLQRRDELVTQGARNVLLTAGAYDGLTPEQQAAAARYDMIIVDTQATLESWNPGGLLGVTPALVPLPVRDFAAFRSVILP